MINSDALKQFAERVVSTKDSIITEEATKMSMIVPFFQLLGYDIFNPAEFCPEFTSDVGIKKGEKVDYAIILDDTPQILIECKWCGEDLNKHGSQLFRYFGTSDAKFGILTNGLTYRFYTDLEQANKMDLKPFFEFEMDSLSDSIINELNKFCKDSFDKDSILSIASELKYTGLIKAFFKSEMDNPTDEFTKYILSVVYDGLKSQKVIDKYKPVVKKSFNLLINELLNQKIASALGNDSDDSKTSSEMTQDSSKSSDSKIVTTQDEIQAFFMVRGILAEFADVADIVYRDTESYFGILYKDNNRKTICRLKLDGKMSMMIPDKEKNYEKIPLESLNDIYIHKQKLIDALNLYKDEN